MVKQVKARRVAAKRSPESKARELWLASLGAASLTRKQGIKLYGAMIDEGRALQSRVVETVSAVGEQFNDAVASVRERVEGVVGPVRERAEATYIVIKDEVETRLQPVLVKLGVVKSKPVAKRVVKAKAVKAKQAAKRVVRRARKSA